MFFNDDLSSTRCTMEGFHETKTHSAQCNVSNEWDDIWMMTFLLTVSQSYVLCGDA